MIYIDKILIEFLKECWNDLESDIMELIKEIIDIKTLCKSFNKRKITLLLRGGDYFFFFLPIFALF